MKAEMTQRSLFPTTLYWAVLAMLLSTAGGNVALILFGLKSAWNATFFVHIVILYWLLVSALIVFYLKRKIHTTYELPLIEISSATEKVSCGNFAVSIPTVNPPEKYNYLDFLILDLNKMVEELSGIETLRTDFISNVSHELNTPLAVMQNYATLLQAPNLDEAVRQEYAKTVSRNCRRLTNLITNILKLNKLENQQIYPTVPAYDLGEQLRECVIAFEDLWSAKNIELTADIADGIMVTRDSQLLSLVWNNFISNAIKFTPEGGRITVGLRRLDGVIQVSVRDSGCGMDEKTMSHVFDKFFQGDSSHATMGNGLGLALASRVAEICKGKIRVESELGKGSVFFFEF